MKTKISFCSSFLILFSNLVFAQFQATEKENPYWYYAPDGQRIEFIPVVGEILIEFKSEAESSVKFRALSQLKVNEKKDASSNVLFKTKRENLSDEDEVFLTHH